MVVDALAPCVVSRYWFWGITCTLCAVWWKIPISTPVPGLGSYNISSLFNTSLTSHTGILAYGQNDLEIWFGNLLQGALLKPNCNKLESWETSRIYHSTGAIYVVSRQQMLLDHSEAQIHSLYVDHWRWWDHWLLNSNKTNTPTYAIWILYA